MGTILLYTDLVLEWIFFLSGHVKDQQALLFLVQNSKPQVKMAQGYIRAIYKTVMSYPVLKGKHFITKGSIVQYNSFRIY